MKTTIKLCAVILALAICLSMTVTAFAEGSVFSDVAETDYFYEAVQWGDQEGITQGVGGNLFDPEGQVTRAQVVTFLWRMQGEPAPAETVTFDDVEAGSWYEVPVRWAVENNITLGTGENKFSPYDVCDRAMCITLLYRIMGSPFDAYDFDKEIEIDENSPEEDLAFYIIREIAWELRNGDFYTDVNEGDYFEIPVMWAKLSGVITDGNTGDDSTVFRSNDPCLRKEMISFLYETKLVEDRQLEPIEYEVGGITVPIPQKYSEVLAIDVNSAIDPDEEGTLITVSELASIEASKAKGNEYEGIGELFSIDRVSEDKLHEMLCGDMSGQEVFAKDTVGNYYIFRTPTDVRFDRETTEKMQEDAEIWTELNEWASDVPYEIYFINDNLTFERFSNTNLDMYLARIAYKGDIEYTVSTTEFGPLEPGATDSKYYAELLLKGGFEMTEDAEAPDGEYAVLNFSEDGVRYDFFKADKDLVRETRDDYVAFYRCARPDYEDVGPDADIVLDWYEALAVAEGRKEADDSLEAFIGSWQDEGGASMMITPLLKTGKYAFMEACIKESETVEYNWYTVVELTDDGKVIYNDGVMVGFDSDAYEVIDNDYTNIGSLEFDNDGKLVWNYNKGGEAFTVTLDKSR